jgi:hypothetical protein
MFSLLIPKKISTKAFSPTRTNNVWKKKKVFPQTTTIILVIIGWK